MEVKCYCGKDLRPYKHQDELISDSGGVYAFYLVDVAFLDRGASTLHDVVDSGGTNVLSEGRCRDIANLHKSLEETL
jgi:hypothetical protein